MLQEQHVIFCEYIIRGSPQGQIFNIWRLLYFTATAAGTVATDATVGTATAVVSAVVGYADVAIAVIVAMRT